MVESGKEVVGEISVEIVQAFWTVSTAFQAKGEVVRHGACEVGVPEKVKVSDGHIC